MAEDLTAYLEKTGIKVRYMHHDVDTIERMEIIRDLRKGEFDVLVGINLLREGLDIPEVSLVAILDADKEGFLRSETSLVQTIGRAARNAEGKVIMYADEVTDSMQKAIQETYRRREIQQRYNMKRIRLIILSLAALLATHPADHPERDPGCAGDQRDGQEERQRRQEDEPQGDRSGHCQADSRDAGSGKAAGI